MSEQDKPYKRQADWKKDHPDYKRPKKLTHNETEIRNVKRTLRLRREDPLPRCMARDSKKVKEYEQSGDHSHSGSKHVCSDCRCDHHAGWGTVHLGYGYCYEHDRHQRKHAGELMAHQQRVLTMQGLPDDPWKYKTTSGYLEQIRQNAEEAKSLVSLREEIFVAKDMIQRILDSFHTNDKKKMFTTMFNGKEVPAPDDVKAKIMNSLIKSVAGLAKIHLEVTASDYVHVDEVKMWVGEFIRIIENICPPEMFEEIINKVKNVPQPVAGQKS